MSDGGDTGGVSVDTTPAESVSEALPEVSRDSAPEIPQEPGMPGIDPEPEETPVIPESPALEPQPTESPVIAPSPVENPTSAAPVFSIRDRLHEAFEALRFRKERRLEKILILARTKGSIKNDDVEKLLRVSDSSAQRYVNQLMVRGKLKRLGSAHQPRYEPL